MRRPWKKIIGVILSAATIAGGVAIWQTGIDENQLANIWIDSNGGTCTDNPNLVAYNDDAACGTFDAANDTADNGDIIYVKTGTAYAGETLSGTNGRTAMATIAAEPNTSRIQFSSDLTLGSIGGDGPDWLTIRGVQCGSDTTSFTNNVNLNIFDQSNDLVIDDWDCPSFDLFDSSRVTIKNSDWGPCSSLAGVRACLSRIAQANMTILASDVTIEDSVFHDIWCGAGDASACDLAHTDGLAVFGSNNLTLRRVKFYRNDITNIRFQDNTTTGRSNTNVLIENSWFQKPCAATTGTNCSGGLNANAIDIDNPSANFVLRFNSFADQSYFQCIGVGASCGTAAQPMISRGNIYSIQAGFCGQTNVQHFYNATNDWGGYTGGACVGSTGDVNGVFPTYVNSANSAAVDFHLSGAAGPADGLVTAGCIATDIDGQARSSTCDAGSDER